MIPKEKKVDHLDFVTELILNTLALGTAGLIMALVALVSAYLATVNVVNSMFLHGMYFCLAGCVSSFSSFYLLKLWLIINRVNLTTNKKKSFSDPKFTDLIKSNILRST